MGGGKNFRHILTEGGIMQLRRREFLKYCIGSAATLGLPINIVGKLEEALAADVNNLPTVIWLNGANCTGCTVSLANLIAQEGPKDIADLLTGYIDLAFHPNLMGAAGDLAVEQLNTAAAGDYILAVDGGIPTAFNGHTCMLYTDNGHEVTAKEAVLSLADKAAAILSIGTCASYGGIPGAFPNTTDVVSVGELIGGLTINIPGCPTHPDWVVWTIANLLAGTVPELDDFNRPMELFGGESKIIHKVCPRKGKGETNVFGDDERCLKPLGCKGPNTRADCPTRKWNNGTNWCIGAGAICVGCTESQFPDKFSPFYKVEYSYDEYTKPNEEPPPAESDLILKKAEWVAEKKELRVEGEANSGSIVTVKNAQTGALLGAVSADGEGKWRFRQNTNPVPSRVRVESGGATLEKDVKNAPSGGGGEPAPDNFILKKAEWNIEKRQLKVEGEGPIGAKVLVANARSGDALATVTVNSDNKWRYKKDKPSSIPCRVLAEIGKSALEKAVKNAPSNCR
jgi:NiFe hydrogenase small subunit HydA